MISIKDQDILNEYAQIKRDLKMLEEKADALNPSVLDVMERNAVEEVDVRELGKLTLGSRRTWKYSKAVQEEEATLKEHKKLEEQTGTADYVEKHYVVFKSNKDNS